MSIDIVVSDAFAHPSGIYGSRKPLLPTAKYYHRHKLAGILPPSLLFLPPPPIDRGPQRSEGLKVPMARLGAKTSFHEPVPNRSDEVKELVDAVTQLIVPYIQAADEAAEFKSMGGGTYGTPSNVLVEALDPATLTERLHLSLPRAEGRGREGLLTLVHGLLRYSVNTWDQGYLDKLCASTNAVGIASEMVVAALNTNSHVYQVSPALTVVEKKTGRELASLFGLTGPHAAGVTCPGGSNSNLTSLITARGVLYPDTRAEGNGGRQFAVFTSIHGHYSIQKAALACGMGMSSVIAVPSDDEGRMDPSALRQAVLQTRAEGRTPLYVSATAGTTVLGAFDPLADVAAICSEFGMWFHVDASWGGGAIFSASERHKLHGTDFADSITFNPHKMLNVPVTCSFLLVRDIRLLHRANTLPAGYLFHGDSEPSGDFWDLGDLTLQCGRRPDSVKLALAWTYYGAEGFGRMADRAFANAAYLAARIEACSDFKLVSSNPPPCLQVCFYYAPGCRTGGSDENTNWTKCLVARMVARGFMIDYAPGDAGSFLRVVVNWQTLTSTIDGIIVALKDATKEPLT